VLTDLGTVTVIFIGLAISACTISIKFDYVIEIFVVDFPQQWPSFDARPGKVGFVVDKVSLWTSYF
jgi:hypothetical protein